MCKSSQSLASTAAERPPFGSAIRAAMLPTLDEALCRISLRSAPMSASGVQWERVRQEFFCPLTEVRQIVETWRGESTGSRPGRGDVFFLNKTGSKTQVGEVTPPPARLGQMFIVQKVSCSIGEIDASDSI